MKVNLKVYFSLLLLSFIAADHPTFTDLSSSLNHLVVDTNSNRIYVGAVNKIYQLSPDLDVEQSEVTSDNSTNNVNNVLVIDYAANRLVSCGSSKGYCSVRNLNNISQVREVQGAMVPENAEASTVAFIAEGPRKKRVMYLGATYASNPRREILPAVSSRSLDDDRLFHFEQIGTKMYINSLSRESYPVNYVYGFSSEGFSYFLTTQLKTEDSNQYYSKLVRICHDDEDYNSYTEIPITCKGEGKDYNLAQAAFMGKVDPVLAANLEINSQQDVLFVAFSSSEVGTPNKPSDNSAVCVYSLKDIRRKFTQNIQSCFSGHGTRGLNFITPSFSCIYTKLSITEDFCGLDINTPLGGEDAVEAVPQAIFNERMTAIVASFINEYTVVFAGTAQGHLKKILLEATTASEYSDVTIDQGSPIKNLAFNSQQSHLYVLTEHKVYKVKVQDCSAYQSCATCLDAKDPYCGWCPSRNKCTSQINCLTDIRDPENWRQRIPPYRNDTCAVITEVKPNRLPLTKFTKLKLFIDNLNVEGQLYCVFKVLDRTIITPATRQSYGVDCDTPPAISLPPVPAGQHQLEAKIYVRTAQETNLAFTNIIFFDCSSYSSCTECASSSYSCDWCIEGDRCTYDSAAYCNNDVIVTGSSFNPASSSCLSFQSKTGSNEILIHSGMSKAITVKVHLTGLFVVQTRFLCEFIIENRNFRVNARLLADTIYCDNFEFTYNSSAPHITASLNILWAGGSKKLDNPDNVHIVIYRCNSVQDCGTCLSMPEKYRCGWCRPSLDNHEYFEECRLQDKCKVPYKWYSRSQTCPDIKIHSFMPHLGPWEGGTKVIINGLNLGRSVSDIKEVIVGGTSCDIVPELYVKTKQIVCTTRRPEEDRRLGEGLVTVRVGEYSGASNVSYSYVDPKIHSIEPTYGSKSGSVLLRITGDNLNAGSDTRVMICDSPCEVVATERQLILCRTTASKEVKNCSLSIHFDRAVRHLSNGHFEYTEDPVILSAYSGYPSSRSQPKGTPKGGMEIKVLGRNFRGVQSANIRVRYNNEAYTGDCHHYYLAPETELRCKAPRIPVKDPIDPENPLELEYDFVLNNIESGKNLYSENGPYLMYPNPTFEKFNEIKILKAEYLTLNGDNLDWVCTGDQFMVRVGRKYGNVTSLSRNQLTLRPPSRYELPPDVEAFDVVVRLARKHVYNIGKIRYDEN